MTGGGLLAFFMELAEYLIVTTSSSLTLSIIGVSKELVTVSISLTRNQTQLSALNYVGMVVCFGGVVAHTIRKAIQPPEHKKHKRVTGRCQETYEKFQMEDFDVTDSSDEETVPTSLTSRRYDPRKTPLLKEGDWSSSDENLSQNGIRSEKKDTKSWKKVDDEFFFQENRKWTSTRDSHLSQLASNQDSRTEDDGLNPTDQFVTDLLDSD